jgi:hypothetical protein
MRNDNRYDFDDCLGLMVQFHSGWNSSPVMLRLAIAASETLTPFSSVRGSMAHSTLRPV